MGILISPNRAMFNGVTEAERAARCIICGLVAERSRGRWLIDTYAEDGCLEGHELTDTHETDHGFTCCGPCASQAAYEKASIDGKLAMNDTLDRLRGIVEDIFFIRSATEEFMPDRYVAETLLECANKSLAALLGGGEPSWSNR